VPSFFPFTLPLTMDSDEELEQTRTRFGNQKGISSDEFFGRDQFDEAAQAEAKQRLQNFEGATSISSNAYFGRPEEDLPTAHDFGSYGDIESAARDLVRRFGITAGDDLEQLTRLAGEGASRLQGKQCRLGQTAILTSPI
jgi:ADP-ribosylation factor GTPase-activating protein 2/3